MVRVAVVIRRGILFIAFVVTGCAERDSSHLEAIGSTNAEVALLCQALAMNYLDLLDFPRDQMQFEERLTNPANGLLRREVLSDGWKRPIRYAWNNPLSVTVWSTGEVPTNYSKPISCDLLVDPQKQTIVETRKNEYSSKTISTTRQFSDYPKTEKKGL